MSSEAKRVVWVKVGGLWPLNTGGRHRSFNLLRELAQRQRVTLLTTYGPGDDPAGLARALPGCERVTSFPHALAKAGTARFAGTLARSWLGREPVDIVKCRVPALRAEVERLIAEGEVDLVIADFLAAVPNVPLDGPPVALFTHNVEHVIWRRLCEVETRPWARALLALEWRKMRRYEARACARASITLAVSELDRELLASHAPRAKVRAIATGVDTRYFSPSAAPVRASNLVFSGAMDWHPNEDGILHFLDAVLPAIRRYVPDVSLTVVGRNPSAKLRARAQASGCVEVTGTVDDVRPHIAAGAVYVVPLRVGGGTRLKIFEALAMAKAVVSTTIGAEGLPLVPGQHYVRADDPGVFAREVVALLNDPERRGALAAAGRRLVEERYAWARVAVDFERICMEGEHARERVRSGVRGERDGRLLGESRP